MNTDVFCLASEKGVVVVNECLKKGIEINTLKLEQLLILIHGIMLSKYNKPFFYENVVARDFSLMIQEVDEDFRAYGIEFKEPFEEYITLLEKEEEVMKYVIEKYGNLDFFDLNEFCVLKKLRKRFIEENKNNIDSKNIIPNIEIEKEFDDFLSDKQKFIVMAVPRERPYTVSSEKLEEFLNHKPNFEARQQMEEKANKLKINNLAKPSSVLKKKIIILNTKRGGLKYVYKRINRNSFKEK